MSERSDGIPLSLNMNLPSGRDDISTPIVTEMAYNKDGKLIGFSMLVSTGEIQLTDAERSEFLRLIKEKQKGA